MASWCCKREPPYSQQKRRLGEIEYYDFSHFVSEHRKLLEHKIDKLTKLVEDLQKTVTTLQQPQSPKEEKKQ